MTFKLIAHLSDEYREMIDLRVRVLLSPIGIPASYITPESEASDILIGAYDNAVLLGCCILTERGNDAVQLRQMAVETGLQGKGLGAAIVAFAEATAKDHGYRLLYMHARNPVIGFYARCGYQPVGEPFLEVGLGHQRMEKTL